MDAAWTHVVAVPGLGVDVVALVLALRVAVGHVPVLGVVALLSPGLRVAVGLVPVLGVVVRLVPALRVDARRVPRPDAGARPFVQLLPVVSQLSVVAFRSTALGFALEWSAARPSICLPRKYVTFSIWVS